jgi:hypothetical protein
LDAKAEFQTKPVALLRFENARIFAAFHTGIPTPVSMGDPKHTSCRFVRPNSILLLIFVRSFGTVTYAIELTSVEKENAFPVRKDVSRNYD